MGKEHIAPAVDPVGSGKALGGLLFGRDAAGSQVGMGLRRIGTSKDSCDSGLSLLAGFSVRTNTAGKMTSPLQPRSFLRISLVLDEVDDHPVVGMVPD